MNKKTGRIGRNLLHNLSPGTMSEVMKHLTGDNIKALHRTSKKASKTALDARKDMMAAAKELFGRLSVSPKVARFITDAEEVITLMNDIRSRVQTHMIDDEEAFKRRVARASGWTPGLAPHLPWGTGGTPTQLWDMLRPLFPQQNPSLILELDPRGIDITTKWSGETSMILCNFDYNKQGHYKVKIAMTIYGNVLYDLSMSVNWSKSIYNGFGDVYIEYGTDFRTHYMREVREWKRIKSYAYAPYDSEIYVQHPRYLKEQNQHGHPESLTLLRLVQIAKDLQALRNFYSSHNLTVRFHASDDYRPVLSFLVPEAAFVVSGS